MYEGGKPDYLQRPTPEPQQGPEARARARAQMHGGWARAKRAECNTVVYTKVLQQSVYVVQKYTSDQKNSVWRTSVHLVQY